jgi:hypothetical protein
MTEDLLKRFTVDVDSIKANNGKQQTPVFSQGDVKTAILMINLKENDVSLDLTDKKVKAAFKKPDNTSVYQDLDNGITITDAANGAIQIILTNQVLAVKGNVRGQISITDEAGGLVAETVEFTFLVRESIVNNSIISSDELPIIEQTIAAAKKLEEIDLEALSVTVETVNTLKSEVETARGTEANLGARIENLSTALAETMNYTEILPENFTLYEPPLASNQWVTDSSGRVLDITTSQFLALFYDSHIGSYNDGLTVTKTSLGKDQSGLYDLYEYDFKPKNYSNTILLTSGMHTYELAASFGLAHFIKHYMTTPYLHDGFKYLRENVRIKVIPVVNPWGFNQNPKTYGNSRGVNFNRNMAISSSWTAYSGNTSEWNQKGTAPFSEAESKILRDWVLTNTNAEFWIDCHTGFTNSDYDNWIYYQSLESEDFKSRIISGLNKLTSRIKTKYGKTTPVNQVNINHVDDLKSEWLIKEVGLSALILEQSSANPLWGTSLNNESGDITEYEVTLCAYIFTFLAPGFANYAHRKIWNLEKVISELTERIISLESANPVVPVVLASDNFDRVDSGTLGITSVGSKTWINGEGTMGIVSGKAKGTITGNVNSYIDVGESDVEVSADITWNAYAGLLFRYNSSTSYLGVRINSSSLAIINNSSALSSYAFTPVVGTTYKVKVIAKGTSIKVFLNDVEVINAEISENQLMTKVGLRTNNDTVSTFDNFEVKTA